MPEAVRAPAPPKRRSGGGSWRWGALRSASITEERPRLQPRTRGTWSGAERPDRQDDPASRRLGAARPSDHNAAAEATLGPRATVAGHVRCAACPLAAQGQLHLRLEGRARPALHRGARRQPRRRRRRVRLGGRTDRLRQEHAAQRRRRPARAEQRHGRGVRRAARRPQPARRLHVPDRQPDALAHGAAATSPPGSSSTARRDADAQARRSTG